jgi:hypothetical protein
MFQPVDARCTDLACRQVLVDKDFQLGICPACGGMIAAVLQKARAEKIEGASKMVENSGKTPQLI